MNRFVGPVVALALLASCQTIQPRTRPGAMSPPTSEKKLRLQRAMEGISYEGGRATVLPGGVRPATGRSPEEEYAHGTWLLLERNENVGAIAAFTSAAIAVPSEARYFVGLGRALIQKGLRREAEAALRTAVALAPSSVEARRFLARAIDMSGARAAARDAWLEVRAIDPALGECHVRLAVNAAFLGSLDEARVHLAAADALGARAPHRLREMLRGAVPARAGRAVASSPQIGPQVRIDVGGGSDFANETTMASVGPTGMEVVGAWNDTRLGQYATGVATSTDGGQTWVDQIVRAPAGNQGSTEGDGMTAYDRRTGTLWMGSMSWGGNGGVFVARKQPGQHTFDPPVMTIVDGSIDKGWMAAGIAPGNPSSTRLYVAYNYGSQHSTDMGQTWTPVTTLGNGIGFLPRVGPNGELYVTYYDYFDGVWIVRSSDGGQTFTQPVQIAVRMDSWGLHDTTHFPGQFRVPPLNYLAVDPTSGALYEAWFDTTSTSGQNYDVDLYFSRSTDGGDTWSAPVIMNSVDPPGDQFWPWLEVDDQGRIHATFYDSRNTVQDDQAFNGMFDVYYTFSEDGGATWSEHRLTPSSFDSSLSGTFMGDYNGVGIGGNRIYPCYVSTQNGDPDIFTNVIVTDACNDVVLAPTSLPQATQGVRYTAYITATGGTPPYVYTLDAGILPPGMTLYPGGVLTGTPSIPGSFAFSVSASDANGCRGTAAYVLVVRTDCPTIDVLPLQLPDAKEDAPYSVTFTATGGTPPITYAVTAGAPPSGLALDPATGVLSGTPLASGIFTFGITATDTYGCTGSRSLDLRVVPSDDYVAGRGTGAPNENRVRVFDQDGAATAVDFLAYAAGTYGTNVGSADLDGGAAAEILTGPGPGPVHGPQVRGFDRDGDPLGKVSYFAYGTLRYGVNVGAGDLDADGYDEVLSGAGPGEVFGPHVRGWNHDGNGISALPGVSFFAYGTLRYGVNVAAGDLDADGRREILTGPGPGSAFGAVVGMFAWSGASVTRLGTFAAFPGTHGVHVAGGDVEGDGIEEIAATPGAGPANAAHFRGFDSDGSVTTALPGFDLVAFPSLYGGRVGLGDVVPGREALIAAAGPSSSAPAEVRGLVYNGSILTPLPGTPIVAFPGSYGASVAGGALGW